MGMAQTLEVSGTGARQSELPALRMETKVLERLTNRQRQILAGLVDGKSRQELSADLGLSPATIRQDVLVIYGVTLDLFGPGSRQDLEEDKLKEAAYELPSEPHDLANELKNLLTRETTRVSSALTLSLQDRLGKMISEWFNSQEPSRNQAVLKKLANSVTSSGPTGEARTKEALELIPAWESSIKGMSRTQALSIIRSETVDFRKAKSYLNNQAKFINAFLKFYLDEQTQFTSNESRILNNSVSTFAEFRAWSVALSDAWVRSRPDMEAKNHRLYLSYWHKFTNSLITKGLKEYSLELVATVEKYLSSETDKQTFIQNLGSETQVNRSAAILSTSLRSTLKVEGDQISVLVNGIGDMAKFGQMKDDLVFLIAQDSLLNTLKVEVTLTQEDNPILVVSFTSPKELIRYRRAIDSLNEKIKQASEGV